MTASVSDAFRTCAAMTPFSAGMTMRNAQSNAKNSVNA